MPKPQTLEICKKYLFDNPKEKLSIQIHRRLIRIRGAFVHWTEFPMKGEFEIRKFLEDQYNVKQSTAYEDIGIIKSLIGNIKSAGKDWHRYRFNAMIEEAWDIATTKDDPKALAMIIREYGKNNQLHIPDSQTIPWEDLIPQLIEPTEDPTVIGLKRIPNVREVAQKLMDKYSADIADNITAVNIEDVEHEEIREDDRSSD